MAGADRTAPPAWGIGLGHGVDDYGFAGHLVIARVRDEETRAGLREAGPESDVFPVHGTGAADSDEAAVGTGQGALLHARAVQRARQGDAGDALQGEEEEDHGHQENRLARA